MVELKNLLQRTSLIADKHEEIQKITGERFNIFSILGKERDEEKTHSAFIGELLNPFGSHNKGLLYISLFEELLNSKVRSSKEWESAVIPPIKDEISINVHLEKHIGKQFNVGGRLDILIDSNNFTICIENKIDAKDTYLQLERYSKYLTEQNKQTLLIYLTPEGERYKNQDKSKTLNNGEDYFCLSYKEDILSWLEECAKASYDTPIVREAIQQYIYLVKKITYQLTSNTMSKEVDKIILSDLKSAEIIRNRYFKTLKAITDKLKRDIIEKLCNEFSFEYKDSKIYQDKYSSVFLKIKELPHLIGIESFFGTGHRDGSLFIGLIEFDKEKRNEEHNYINGGWLDSSIRNIWNKDVLFQKIEEYNNNPQKVIEELTQQISAHIRDYLVKFKS